MELVVIVVCIAAVIAVCWSVSTPHSSTQFVPSPNQITDRRISDDFRNLKRGDLVDYDCQNLTVTNTVCFLEGGYTWKEHMLEDQQRTQQWVSVEEDHGDILLTMLSYRPGLSHQSQHKTIVLEGITFTREEHSWARYSYCNSTGQVIAEGRVEYVTYKAPRGLLLSFRRFNGGEWDAYIGTRVPQSAFTIVSLADTYGG